jgi:hypothetical protein
MNREEMIEWLIDNDLNDWDAWNGKETGRHDYFAFLLKVGFVGYANQTDEELLAEINERKGV